MKFKNFSNFKHHKVDKVQLRGVSYRMNYRYIYIMTFVAFYFAPLTMITAEIKTKISEFGPIKKREEDLNDSKRALEFMIKSYNYPDNNVIKHFSIV